MTPVGTTPIRVRLMVMMLATSGVALLLACGAFVGYELFTYRGTASRQLTTLGRIIAAESTGAMAFDNPADAAEILGALRAEEQIEAAALYDQRGRLFARYPEVAPLSEFPLPPPEEGYRFTSRGLESVTPVIQLRGSERFGTLYLRSNLSASRSRLHLYGGLGAAVLLLASLVAYLTARQLQRQISGPIQALAKTAEAVSEQRNYAVRVAKTSDDELGVLTDAFNHMLSRIQQQNADLEKRVRERTIELEESNAELEAFCSSAAHDLRTPIRAITGFSEMMLDPRNGDVSAGTRRYLELIRAGSLQMSRMVQDLLDFSRFSRQELVRKEVVLASICHEAWNDLVGDREGRTIEFMVGDLPTVHADPALLRLVFVNLLSNALKYSRQRNPARVEVRGERLPDAHILIAIEDNGVGFAMEEASGRLFGVFQRLHASPEFDGTGVGLATVRRIIERHGGRVWASAEPDHGATFSFTLPVGAPETRLLA